jgi:hypothetical protein
MCGAWVWLSSRVLVLCAGRLPWCSALRGTAGSPRDAATQIKSLHVSFVLLHRAGFVRTISRLQWGHSSLSHHAGWCSAAERLVTARHNDKTLQWDGVLLLGVH